MNVRGKRQVVSRAPLPSGDIACTLMCGHVVARRSSDASRPSAICKVCRSTTKTAPEQGTLARAERTAVGLCSLCGAKASEGANMCEAHRTLANAYTRRSYAKKRASSSFSEGVGVESNATGSRTTK